MLIYNYQQIKEVDWYKRGGTNMHIIIAFILYIAFTTKKRDSKSQAGYDRAVWLSQSFSRK